MAFKTFAEFFGKATGGNTPYDYQSKLAETDSIPQILKIPTGAGKTEAAVLALYLWRRVNRNHPKHGDTPRRLVYCLPMRVLVEQTVSRILGWIQRLGLEGQFQVVTLMGGDVDTAYRKWPEKDTIIVGTQDMLLSRALNRGYSMSPFQWPTEFGLLNNDCMWVVDEIQIMHNGLATTAQLEAFRTEFSTFGPHKTVWMSATMNRKGLCTPDFKEECKEVELGDKDLRPGSALNKIHTAAKKLERLDLPDHKDEYSKKDANAIVQKHKGGITLVIVNTVKRAQSLFKEIQKTGHGTMLIHSRFRKGERDAINKRLMRLDGSKDDLILVSTQVVEAGIDLSAKTLITEMSPWPSMIQRFGRCNRRGLYGDSKVYVVDVQEEQYAPYDPEDMEYSRQCINDKIGHSVSPKDLPTEIERPVRYDSIIRKVDMLGLFDTGYDLMGKYTDVSGFVRSLEISPDVDVLWRTWDGTQPTGKARAHEICKVPIDYAKKMKRHLWVYSSLSGEWERLGNGPYPGQTLLLNSEHGGYDETNGFDQSSSKRVGDATIYEGPADMQDDTVQDSHDGDVQSENSGWITLNDHTVHVINEAEKITERLRYFDGVKENIMTAAKYHDIGKAHHVFQETMLRAGDKVPDTELWAKCPHKRLRHRRENFRHEAVSAVAFQKLGLDLASEDSDLVSYLIASHHGKMRLSMRSMPRKRGNTYANAREDTILGLCPNTAETVKIFASAKTQTEQSSEQIIQEKNLKSEVQVDASMAHMGKNGNSRSWTQMALEMLEAWGPFRLAYLEAAIRAADSRASEMERT